MDKPYRLLKIPARHLLKVCRHQIIWISLVILLKLLLIADHEIVLEPHDALNYAFHGDEPEMLGVGTTGYTYWLRLGKMLAVPQRLAIEILWWAASACLAFSVGSLLKARWLIVPCFAAAVFAPQTYYLFDRALTEGFFLCLSAFALASAIRVFRGGGGRGRTGTLVVTGLLIGYMAIARNEAVLLFAFLGALAVLLGLFDWLCRRLSLKASFFSALAALGIISVSAALIPGALTWYNGKRHGVYTRSFAEMPSHMKLLKKLAEIDTGETNPRFVPITLKAREMAYAQSPTLARFRKGVENPQSDFQKASLDFLKMPGEIGAGWIWHVFNAAGGAKNMDLRAMDRAYRKAIREIEAGFAAGKYRRRLVLHPFLGGTPSSWLPFLGQGMRHAMKCAILPQRQMDDADIPPEHKRIFDRVCMRRISLIPIAGIRGWSFARDPNFPVTGILAGEAPANPPAPLPFLSRPDVQKAFQPQGLTAPVNAGFDVASKVSKSKNSVPLTFFSGTNAVGRTESFEKGKVTVIPGTHGDIFFQVDEFVSSKGSSLWRDQFKAGVLGWVESPAPWIFGLSLSMACLLGLVFLKKTENTFPLIFIAAVFAGWAAMRLGFYSLLSAAAWNAEPRYLQNTAFFGFFFIVVTILGTIHELAIRRSAAPALPPTLEPALL